MRSPILSAFAFLAIGIASASARAEDDPDRIVRLNNWSHASESFDFVRDDDGVIVMAHIDGSALDIRTSSDDGATWTTVYSKPVVQQGWEYNSVSVAIARGFAKAPHDRMVHVAFQYTWLGNDEDGLLLYSGPYDRPWLPAEQGTTWYWSPIWDATTVYYNRKSVEVMDLDLAVVPDFSDGYSVVTVYEHPRFDGTREVWMSENAAFGWWDAHRPIVLAGEQGQITRDAGISFGSPSIAADPTNGRAVIAWSEDVPRAGGELTFAEYYVPFGYPSEIFRRPDLFHPVVAVNNLSEIYFTASSTLGQLSLFFDDASRGGGPMSPLDLGDITADQLSRRPDLEVREHDVRLTTIEPIDQGSTVGAVYLYAGTPGTTRDLTREQISDPGFFPRAPYETPKLSFSEATPIAYRDVGSAVLLDP